MTTRGEPTRIDRAVAVDVLGWRLGDDGLWYDRADDLTGYVDRWPEWWMQVPDAWRLRMRKGPRLWLPSGNRNCLRFLMRRLRLNGFLCQLVSDEQGWVQAAQVRSPSGVFAEVWREDLTYGEALCHALLESIGHPLS